MDEPSAPPAPSALTVLDYLLDEIRQTSGLLRVADTARTSRRPWWKTFVFGLIRAPTEVSADMNLLYVGQNIDRSRDHWRQALAHRADLQRIEPRSDVITRLDADLTEARMDEVLPRLRHEAIPSPVKAMTAHLAGVVDTIRDCDRLVLAARSRLLLERMRAEPAD